MKTKQTHQKSILILLLGLAGSCLTSCAAPSQPRPAAPVQAAQTFVRFKVVEPASENLRVLTTGHIHQSPWRLPTLSTPITTGVWSDWIDLSAWPLHARKNRVGGLAEWPSLKLRVARTDSRTPIKGGSVFEVQLADKPDETGVVITFTEKSAADTIGFLLPYPLRENAKEFETGTQMTARHLAWAKEATGEKPIALKNFEIVTTLNTQYDPALTRQSLELLRLLGFNVVSSNTAPSLLREFKMRPFKQSFNLYGSRVPADPAALDQAWQKLSAQIQKEMATADGRWSYENAAHFRIGDETSTLSLEDVAPEQRNAWFRGYLQKQGVTNEELGRPLAEVEFPVAARDLRDFPKAAPLPERRLMYYAAKFGHWWSAQRLRQSSDLIHGLLPNIKTETLPAGHPFFGSIGDASGMSARLFDLFELGAQQAVDELSAEDWLGLNHMYGPGYTWTGAQSFEYLNAILRSAIADKPMKLASLITPSDDKYLRLKAYSSLGQGAKSFFFWTFGPTYTSTENYWSDLRSEYDGIAKFNRALAAAEEVVYPAQPVRDPVAILYSVSHEIWHNLDRAAFVEKRLLWHALRHQQVQPDFLREEDLAARLKDYKVLYIADWCVSRAASTAIDQWVREGGVLYLSAGAATRDEFYEPYTPPFARAVWPENAAGELVTQHSQRPPRAGGGVPLASSYNERTDLPTLKPMATVKVDLGGPSFDLPVLGARLNLRSGLAQPLATFDDGAAAGALVSYGRGKVLALGFLPMLAYGQLAGFKPTTLEEKWPTAPRLLIERPLREVSVTPVAKADVPVVETSLLTGANGSALVLANYTYQPIDALTVDVKLAQPVARALSTEGKSVGMEKIPGGVRLQLPLEWTDIVLLLPQ